MISILFDTPFLVIVLVLGAVTYMIAKPGKPEKIRFLEFLLLTIVTTGVFLFDNPLRSNPYAGLLFYVFDFYIFTPVSLAFGFTAIYKSNKHLKHYPSGYSKFLRLNEEMGIILLLPLFGISSIIQFIVGEIERKRVQKFLQQRNEDPDIQNIETTEEEPHEN